jgi:hypothetical protein
VTWDFNKNIKMKKKQNGYNYREKERRKWRMSKTGAEIE